jgi:hypothetical protein
MFSEDKFLEGYKYPKPSIEGGTVLAERSQPAPLSRENADKIREAVVKQSQ